ncbi:hypothetical protein N473_13540 [Pseudoalteromonas luteoviolacea CPMOR-1]|uniref:Uncharacterized protein n=1 Tax=Pseudoalteromonas luteoviolacea CPMOR-1 TaxID=1365248 RepID=A0A167LLV7_9GAMM|nr:hypothetical protein N473_13540 [Pseudoalteromonas luteoviolacea CPMOR-1]
MDIKEGVTLPKVFDSAANMEDCPEAKRTSLF